MKCPYCKKRLTKQIDKEILKLKTLQMKDRSLEKLIFRRLMKRELEIIELEKKRKK